MTAFWRTERLPVSAITRHSSPLDQGKVPSSKFVSDKEFSMNGHAKFLAGIVLLCVATSQVFAQTGCVPDRPGQNRNGKIICGQSQSDSGCATNRSGELVCTTPGGGMKNDLYGELLCGPGNCVTDQRNNILCSGQPSGAASLDQTGNAVCSGGCVPATKEACIRPVSK